MSAMLGPELPYHDTTYNARAEDVLGARDLQKGGGVGACEAEQEAATPPVSPYSVTRVCVLNSSYEGVVSELKDVDNFDCTPAHYVKDSSYSFHTVAIHKNTAYQQIRDLVSALEFDVFFNLCDGAKEEARAGMEVVQALEEHGAAFTGAVSKHYEPTKVDMKMLAVYAGIAVPGYALCTTRADVEEACKSLSFPVIVKHSCGYSSIGMTKASKCSTPAELHREASRFMERFGEVLVEEFIEGIEVTVLACEDPDQGGARAFHPIQVSFPPGEDFKHFDLKWVDYQEMQWKSVADPEVARACERCGLEAFKAIMGGVGYGRSDLRVCSKTGTVYLLEINPNCGLFYPADAMGSADYILANERGYGPDKFAKMMIQAALKRQREQNRRRPPHEVFYSKQAGYMVRAARQIRQGEVVFDDEGRPFNLVSKGHVDRAWSKQDRQVFARYAWPLSEHVYVTWSEDHRAWRPLNHSCDPNLWFQDNHSLNVLARRDISSHEQLTMDYATFCGDVMAPFECQCGAADCRGTVRGTDYTTRSDLRERYGTRVTSYVWSTAQHTPATTLLRREA